MSCSSSLARTLIELYCAQVSQPLAAHQWQHYLALLPPSLHPSITRFRQWQDQHRALWGKLLLRHALQVHGHDPATLQTLEYTAHHRPYLPGLADFNLSHSGTIVVCAWFAQGRVGVDVEWQDRKLSLPHFKSIFSPAQWAYLHADPEQTRARFFHLWTAKEALIKADGRGLGIGSLAELAVENQAVTLDAQTWYLYPVTLAPQYSAHIAADQADVPIHLTWFDQQLA